MAAEPDWSAIESVLENPLGRRFVGASLHAQVMHARHCAEVASAISPAGRWLDLGSGGGLPGLVCAAVLPESRWVLLDGSRSRVDFLEWAVATLELGERVSTEWARAENYGQGAARGSFDGVMARGFGPPAATAECGAPLLRLGGSLVVSEPPAAGATETTETTAVTGERWPAEGLATLGLRLEQRLSDPIAAVRLQSVAPCPAAYPRRVGVPARRPLF